MEEVIFHDNGTKVAAVNTKTYIFQPDMSRGPESELIRTVNVPAVVSMAPHVCIWLPSWLRSLWPKRRKKPAVLSFFPSACRLDIDGAVQGLSVFCQSDLVVYEGQRRGPLHHTHCGRASVGLRRCSPESHPHFVTWRGSGFRALLQGPENSYHENEWGFSSHFFFCRLALCVLWTQPPFVMWFQRNASDDGEYVFLTGQEDYKDFARLDTWNNQR